MRRRCIALHHYWLNTKNSIRGAAVPERMIQRGNSCSLAGEATRPVPQGLLDQVWFFLLILEAIHPLTDFRGYFCCMGVGGGVWKKYHSFLL